MSPAPVPNSALIANEVKDDDPLAFVGFAMALAAGVIGNPRPVDGIVPVPKDQAQVAYDGLKRAMKVIDGIGKV